MGVLGGVQDDAVRDEHSVRGAFEEGEQDKDPTLLAHALTRLPGHAGRRPSTSILASSTPIHRGTGHWTHSDVRGALVPRELNIGSAAAAAVRHSNASPTTYVAHVDDEDTAVTPSPFRFRTHSYVRM